MRAIRVVHYVNQFFGGIGGEDKAGVAAEVRDGPVGPGRALEAALGERGQVVATVICGDNYFAEDTGRAAAEVVELLRPYRPDLVVAGPAFNAGRYGVACASVCNAVVDELGVPAVTGMYEDNPGLELRSTAVYVVRTAESARGTAEAAAAMVRLGLGLAAGDAVGSPSEEGYFPRGVLVNEVAERTGAERVVEMLLAKLSGEPFECEVSRPVYDRVEPAPPIGELASATIALVTDGGLVPKGNPDRIEIRSATRFGRYDITGVEALDPGGYEISHEGYDSVFVREDPNRLVPVDALRRLEQEGLIGKLHERFYSTTGVASSVEVMQKLGETIARELREDGVSGVILTST